MRVLWQATLLTAVSGAGCVSSNTQTQDTKISQAPASEEIKPGPRAIENVSKGKATIKTPAGEVAPSPPPTEVTEVPATKSPCEKAKKPFEAPVFLSESHALVIDLVQSCVTNEKGQEILATKLSAVGVSCTGAPGLVTRKGHSNQNWEVINFKLDLSCAMRPTEDLRVAGKKKFGLAAEPTVRAFVPLMVDYWEFEQNSDAGIGAAPTLSERGGGAQQWNKGVQKGVSFPVKLYGRFSSWGDNLNIYEARATLLPRSNQRQFDVTVQDMKQLTGEESLAAKDRCMTRTGQKSACNDAFGNPQ